MAFDPKYIRDFSIVAHIDHGKSTLADQLLLQSGAITQREFREQLLDDMDLERERGITIKARAVAINYTLDGQVYELNLIDTPGHVDFHYEVSRSLAACEGAILLVDATQGVQAQTVANAVLAVGNDLTVVPVLNKIDMQAARPEEIKEEIMHTLGIDPAEILAVSAKTGQGVPDVFRAIIDRVPPPSGNPSGPLRALIFDSKFDDYQGVITYVRVVDGALKVGQKIRLMAGGTDHEVTGLERESNLALVQTAPNVTYEIVTRKGETLHISNPTRIPDPGDIEEFREPIAKVNFILPADCIGAIMQLCEDRRGFFIKTEYLSPTRAILTYELPLAEMIYDLYDKLKSATRGYGTMDYELIGYRAGDLCRLDIVVAGQKVDALSVVVHRAHADRRGRKLVRKLKGEIDRHQFEVAIQAAIGSRVIARETISALRKNVTAKCYGGDITRKRKLLEKQKEGKKRMKQVGNVEISQDAFLSVLDDTDD